MPDSSHGLNHRSLFAPRILLAVVGMASVLVSVLLFLVPSQAEEPTDQPVIWVADKTSINRIDATTNAITQTLPVADKPTALALDAKDRVLWVLTKETLLKFNADSSLVLEVSLKDLAKEFEKPKGLLINPYDQSLWIRSEKSLLHIDNTGKLLHTWKSKDNIQQFKLAPDHTVWVLTKKNLLQLSKEALPQQQVDLKKHNIEAHDIAVDSLGNIVWLASKKQLARLDANDVSKAPTIVYTAKDDDATNSAIPLAGDKIHQLVLDKQTGVLWLSSKKQLSSINRTGQLQSNTALTKDIEKPSTLVFEPISRSVWLGSENAVLRFSTSGTLIKQIAVDDELQALGATPFRLIPTVEFVAPGEGATTNNPLTPIQFKLGSQCNGVSCDIGDAHLKGLNLQVTLNGTNISKAFKITGNTATYQPTVNLSEGLFTLTAKATDRFGQVSDTITGKFTVDTTPPAFTTVNPGDGTTVVTSKIIISGAVDDASATVIVEDLLNLGGKILSADPSNFSFQMPLKLGLNTFTLTAQDSAGNQATKVLNITRTPPLVLNPIGNQTAPIGQTLSFKVTATAPGTAKLKFSVLPLPLPTNARFDAGTQVFTFKPDGNQAGSYSLTFSVTDGALIRNETVIITVPAVDANAPTSLKGRLLDANSSSQGQTLPIVGAKVTILGSTVVATTDAQGYFTLQGVPSGAQVLDIDTQTANPAPGGAGYAGFREKFTVLANVNNVIERPLYLPRIETISLTTINPNTTTVVTNTRLGITLTIPANTAKNSDGTNFTGQLSISEVPRNLAPAPLPEGLDPGLLITIQPVGVSFASPVPITFPNTDNLPAGTEVNIWSLDPDKGIFTVVGIGKVTPDGQSVVTISGGIRAADWHAILPPSGTAENVAEQVGNHFNPDQSDCRNVSSTVDSKRGCLSTSFSLPGYLSLGEARGLTFVYRTERAFPHPVIPFDFTIPVRSAVPPLVSYQLSLGGETQANEPFVSTAGLGENVDETIRAVASINASNLKTGSYPYRARLTNHFTSSRVSTFIGGNAIVVNEQESPYGAGWGVAGLSRLHINSDSSALITDGDGSHTRFTTVIQAPVNFPNFSDILALTLNGVAPAINSTPVVVNGQTVLRLANGLRQSGSAFLTKPVVLGLGNNLSFNTQFTFQITNNHGIGDSDGIGADGFGFVIQSQSNAALGIFGSGMVPSLAVEFDTFRNATGNDSASGNHIGININGNLVSVAFKHINTRLNNGGIWYVWIDYDNDSKQLEVRLAQTSARPDIPTLTHSVDLASILGQSSAFVGFAAGTGGGAGNHDIRSWAFASAGAKIGFSDQFISPAGDFTALSKNTDGSFTLSFRDGSKIHFNTQGLQTSVADRNNNTTTYAYDSSGRLIKITDPVGQATTLSYSGNNLASVTDPAGRVTSFAHDSNNNLTQVTFPDASTRSFGYDQRHLMTSETDARNFTTTRQYDFTGRLVSATLANGSVRKTTNAQSTGLVNPASGVGTKANPAPFTRPTSVKSSFIDGENRSRTVNTDSFGAANRIIDSAGLTTVIDRNNNGDPTRILTPDGASTALAYDTRGNLLSSTDATLGGTTKFTYESIFNQITSVTDARGKTSSIAYDTKGNPTAVTSPLGRKSTFTYNTRGQPLAQTDVFGTTTSVAYNTQGNAQNVTLGSGVDARSFALAYTPAGLLKTLTDPLGRTLNLTYDAQGRVTQQTLPDGRAIAFAYDPAGNLASITPPGRTAHVFAYTNVDEEKVYTPPALGANTVATTFQYNKERQLTKITRPDAQQITFAYDSAGRLQTTQLPRGPIGFQYSSTTGQLTNITAPGAIALSYGYNKQLITSETVSGPITGTVSRSFDPDFRITGLAVGTQNIAYAYDDDGLLIQAGSLTLQRNLKTGRIDSTGLGTVSSTRGYNPFGEISSHSASAGSTTLYNVVYVRDKLGRITKKTETLAGDIVVFDYQYDVAGRLTTVSQNGVPTTYTYDTNSNRLSQIAPPGTTSGTYDAQDRLLSYGNTTYAYNNNGDLQTKTQNGQTTQYTYDVIGNLTKVTLPNATTIDYLIDGRNRRIGKKVNGTLVQGFLYQDQLNPIAELNGSGGVVARFIYGSRSNTPDYMIKGGQTYRIISDHLGSPRLVINTLTGNVEQRLDYDTFGNITRDTNPGFQPFGFAGGIYDSDTKLVRFGARDYDPVTGRWTTKDPIRFQGRDTNLYGYVLADPVNWVDPNGKFSIFAFAVAAVVTVTAIGIFALKGTVEKSLKSRAQKVATASMQRADDVAGGMSPIEAEKKRQETIKKFNATLKACVGFGKLASPITRGTGKSLLGKAASQGINAAAKKKALNEDN